MSASAQVATPLTNDTLRDGGATVIEHQQMMRSYFDLMREFEKDNVWMAARDAQREAYQRNLPKREKGRMLDILRAPSLIGTSQFFNPDKMSLATKKRMMLDSQVAACYQVIVNAVLSRGYEITGGTRETLKFVRQMYENLPMFKIFQQAMSAFWVGFSATEKVFNTDDNGLEFISNYKVLPPQTISFDIEDNGKINWIYQSGHNIGIYDRYVRWRPDAINLLTYDGGINDTFGNPYGVSGLKPAYRDWWSKDIVLQLQNRMLERNAGGLTWIHAGWASAEEIKTIAEQYKTSGMMVTTGEQQVKQFEPATEGSAFLESVVYHDIQIAKAMLVPPILLDQASKFGSRSLGQIHLDMFKLGRIVPWQQMLTNWAERDIRQLVDHNFGVQEPGDDGRSTYPQFKFKAWSHRELEMMANFYLKGAKGQWIGRNDIAYIRNQQELPDGDFDSIGEPLIMPRGSGNPSGSGSAGDAISDGTDVGSGGDVQEQLESLTEDFREMQDKLDLLISLRV